MAISVKEARQICTKAELDLVLQSTTRNIGNLDAKQLKAAIRRARTMRDKWRDLAKSQTRGTKADNPAKLGTANARSGEKAQLFDEVLGRFEKRLSKVDPSTQGASADSKKPAKKTRAAAHRAGRADARGTLNEATETINAQAQPRTTSPKAKKKAAAAKSTEKSAGKPTAKSKKVSAKKPAAKKASAKAPPKRKRPAASNASPDAAAPASTAVPVDGLAAAAIAAGRDPANMSSKPTSAEKKRNLKAKAAAKATAVSRSGAPRILGHVSSQGRRNQAKRNTH